MRLIMIIFTGTYFLYAFLSDMFTRYFLYAILSEKLVMRALVGEVD